MALILTNTANVTDNGDFELLNAIAATTAVVGGTTYLFVAGQSDDGVSVFAVGADGSLANVHNVTDNDDLLIARPEAVTTAVVGGTTYLFVAGLDDDGVSVFAVGPDGSLANVDNVADGGDLELNAVVSVATAVVGGKTYLFTAAVGDDGVSVFEVGADGSLTNKDNVTDGDDPAFQLNGASGLAAVVVDGKTYLFVAAQLDNGVSVFEVGADGVLTNKYNITDGGDPELQLNQARDVKTATVGATTYLFVAGLNGVSVFAVGADGSLTNVENVADDPTLALENIFSITTAVVDGTTYLFAAAASDDGVSVFAVGADGSLTHMRNIDDDGDLQLDGVSFVTTAVVGGVTRLFATGSSDSGVSAFALLDNAGDDTYVVDDPTDIVDETGGDGIDTVLSSISFSLADPGRVLGDVENLTLLGTAANGTGNALANTIIGNGADNLLDGLGGSDVMRGLAGNDTYVVDDPGDIVDETAAGSGGIDIVLAAVTFTLGDGVENLTLTGAAAIDGTGNDLANVLTGNTGANVLDGGLGNDSLSGGLGADRFVFDTAIKPKGSNVDTLADFSHADDTILLDNAIFTKLKKDGALKKKFFEVGKKADDGNDFIVYNKKTGDLFYDKNGDDKGGAVLLAVLEGSPNDLSKADFLVI